MPETNVKSEERGAESPSRLQRGPRFALLLAILGVFFAYKLEFNPIPIGHARPDSTFYYQLARNVAEGKGLRTSVSLYHQGLRDLPARTTIYPLWPLVAGTIGRVIGIERAATLLPEALYLLALVLLYLVAARLARDGGVRALVAVRGVPVVDLGHVAVMILALNRPFFLATSTCMTEGLAFSLLFASLLALSGARCCPVLCGALSGALGCLAFLARAQLILLPAALVATLAIVGLSDARFRRAALSAAGGAAAVFLPWVLYVASLPGEFDPRSFFIFTAYQETPALGTTSDLIVFDSLRDRLTYMLSGVRIAFDATSPNSYFRSFGASIYVVPVALLVAIPALVRRARGRAGFGADALLALGVFLVAGACLLPVHALNTSYPKSWFFQARHGIPLILALVLGLHTLLRHGTFLRLLAFVFALSVLVNWNPGKRGDWRMATTRLTAGSKDPRIWPVESDLVTWLDEHDEPPVSATIKCRELAGWSHANFHWLRADLAPDTPKRMFELLDLDYLIVYHNEVRFEVYRHLARNFERLRRFRRNEQWIDVLTPRGRY